MPKKYIDAEEAKKAWYIELGITSKRAAIGVNMVFDRIPAADVEAVRHGEWKTTVSTVLHNNGEQSTYYGYRCTVCKEDADKSFLFCPNCGAKMDRKESNE